MKYEKSIILIGLFNNVVWMPCFKSVNVNREIYATGWKAAMVFVIFLISRPIYAQEQEEWTKNDSVKLSKMLNGEVPIHIDDAFKKELEHSLIGNPIKHDGRRWDDFILDINSNNKLLEKSETVNYNTIYYKPFDNKLFNKKSEYLKIKSLVLNSQIDTDNPYINLQRNTDISTPLNNKLRFNIYGSYALDKKRSAILPASSIPYTVGAGFSYNINKNAVIKSQTNYQYNIIKKKWEWFVGGKFGIKF